MNTTQASEQVSTALPLYHQTRFIIPVSPSVKNVQLCKPSFTLYISVSVPVQETSVTIVKDMSENENQSFDMISE